MIYICHKAWILVAYPLFSPYMNNEWKIIAKKYILFDYVCK